MKDFASCQQWQLSCLLMASTGKEPQWEWVHRWMNKWMNTKLYFSTGGLTDSSCYSCPDASAWSWWWSRVTPLVNCYSAWTLVGKSGQCVGMFISNMFGEGWSVFLLVLVCLNRWKPWWLDLGVTKYEHHDAWGILFVLKEDGGVVLEMWRQIY